MCECEVSATNYGQIWQLCEVETSMLMDAGINGPEVIVNKLYDLRARIAALESCRVAHCLTCRSTGLEDDGMVCRYCLGMGCVIGPPAEHPPGPMPF